MKCNAGGASASNDGLGLRPVAHVVRRINKIDGSVHDRIEPIDGRNASDHLHEYLFTEAQVMAVIAAERERCDSAEAQVMRAIADIRRQAEEIERLRVALDQVVDDMADGHCVCEAAKQQAIAALWPNAPVKPGP